MATSNDDVDDRLEWYNKTFHPEEAEPQSLDTHKLVFETFETLKNRPLYVCERKRTCSCKNKREACVCDADDYYEVTYTNTQPGANCMCSCEFVLGNAAKLSRKMTWRFFTLGETPDSESVAFDIQRYKSADKSSGLLERIVFPVTAKTPALRFDIMEGVRLRDGVVSFCFNYMSYEL